MDSEPSNGSGSSQDRSYWMLRSGQQPRRDTRPELAPICALRSLWRVTTIVTLAEKPIFDLSVDLVQPLLSALGLLSVCFNPCLKLGDTILGSPKLVRKFLRRVDCVPAVLLSNISSLVQKLEDRLTGLVELSVVVSPALSRSFKWNHFGAHC
jgi:hypothetical protein